MKNIEGKTNMTISIDHVVMTVKDINKSIYFYSGVLDMKLVEFISSSNSTRRKSLKFGNQKINLHESMNPLSLMQTILCQDH